MDRCERRLCGACLPHWRLISGVANPQHAEWHDHVAATHQLVVIGGGASHGGLEVGLAHGNEVGIEARLERFGGLTFRRKEVRLAARILGIGVVFASDRIHVGHNGGTKQYRIAALRRVVDVERCRGGLGPVGEEVARSIASGILEGGSAVHTGAKVAAVVAMQGVNRACQDAFGDKLALWCVKGIEHINVTALVSIGRLEKQLQRLDHVELGALSDRIESLQK